MAMAMNIYIRTTLHTFGVYCFYLGQFTRSIMGCVDSRKSKTRTKVTISLLEVEVVLGLLQPLHLVIDLQVGLRLLKMVPNDFPWPKTWC